jgi:predicted short-subunit dehydrogenase-like oxidoreductase (DUF2520 family)
MAPNKYKTAVLIGAGNLAFHLGQALFAKGIKIMQVFSRTETSAKPLADILNATFTTNLDNIIPDADYYIICVKDDAITEVVKAMPAVSGIVMHTSGSIEISVLQKFAKAAVFYPLQTFSKSKANVDFELVPICIEANSSETLTELKKLASLISSNVQEADSAQRKTIHLAAVFACNFSNHLFSISADLLAEQNLDFSLLLPLIEETFSKIKKVSPAEAQTGPAKRKDFITINKQLELLKDQPELANIYSMFSEGILKKQK